MSRTGKGMMGRLKTVIVTQYDLPEWKRNMNQYQRPYHGAGICDVALLVRKGAEVSAELRDRVRLIEAPVRNKAAFILYALITLIRLRTEGYRMVLTDPSVTSVVGLGARFLAGYFWVLDIWDPPRRRLDAAGRRQRARLSDRLVFFSMNRASFAVFSGLRQQAPQIRIPADRSIECPNAIDLRDIARDPPVRSPDDPTLHVAIARSVLHEESGIQELVLAAEELMSSGCPFRIHLVGRLTPATEQVIARSPAADCFIRHGFISASRTSFFRDVHVGCVPYRATEDLSYIYPIKVMEHLSQGNPVIASDLPGLSRMVQHEQNGLIFHAGDAGSLASAISRLQRDADFWRVLAENAITSSRQYDAAGKNRYIFETLVARARAHRQGNRSRSRVS